MRGAREKPVLGSMRNTIIWLAAPVGEGLPTRRRILACEHTRNSGIYCRMKPIKARRGKKNKNLNK